jgi:hypothetical protein
MVDRGGAGGTNGATGTGGTVTAGTGGEADASTIPDATFDGAIVDGVACCPPECEGHACACLGGACCWLMVPGRNPACAKACFPHG